MCRMLSNVTLELGLFGHTVPHKLKTGFYTVLNNDTSEIERDLCAR